MVYLGLPVWPFEIDWSQKVAQTYNYDARQQQIGFGAEVLEPLQQYVTHEFRFTVDLDSPCAINRLERFFAASFGRLRGWWLPGPMHELSIRTQHSATQVDMNETGLADVFASNPAVHLWLEDAMGENSQIAQVTGVAALGGGIERLTLSAALGSAIDPSWNVRRLYLVRLTKDEVVQKYLAPGRATVEMDCYELPLEYAATELGDQPIHLYLFTHTTAGVTQSWYYTSHDVAVVHMGQTWSPQPITHGQMVNSVDGISDAVEVTSWRFDGNALNDYFPFPPQKVYQVTIRELFSGASQSKVLFAGRVKTVKAEGRKLTAQCVTALDADLRQIPRMRMQRLCPYTLFDYGCKLSPAAFVVHSVLTVMAGALVTVNGAYASRAVGYYLYGYVVATAPDGTKEMRQIVWSLACTATQAFLTLNAPFQHVVVGAAIDVYPGCDLLPDTCKNKFNNFVNYGGMPFVDKNLALKAVKQKQSTGTKKG